MLANGFRLVGQRRSASLPNPFLGSKCICQMHDVNVSVRAQGGAMRGDVVLGDRIPPDRELTGVDEKQPVGLRPTVTEHTQRAAVLEMEESPRVTQQGADLRGGEGFDGGDTIGFDHGERRSASKGGILRRRRRGCEDDQDSQENPDADKRVHSAGCVCVHSGNISSHVAKRISVAKDLNHEPGVEDSSSRLDRKVQTPPSASGETPFVMFGPFRAFRDSKG